MKHHQQQHKKCAKIEFIFHVNVSEIHHVLMWTSSLPIFVFCASCFCIFSHFTYSFVIAIYVHIICKSTLHFSIMEVNYCYFELGGNFMLFRRKTQRCQWWKISKVTRDKFEIERFYDSQEKLFSVTYQRMFSLTFNTIYC